MKAAIVVGPDSVCVEDIPEPALGPYQARCELLFGAICAGTDSHIVDGSFPWIGALPTVLGHESVGRVVEVGAKVRHLSVGDLVPRVGTMPVDGYSVTWGGFAGQGIAVDHRAMAEDGCPERDWRAYRMQRALPADTDPAAATMFITWRETFSYIQRMGVNEGDRVLVIGSGGNGLAFASHARNLGAAHVAMLGSRSRAQRAERAGVDTFIDYRADDAKTQASNDAPEGFDHVIDAVGKSGLGTLGLSLLKPGGTLGIYGLDDLKQLHIDPTASRGDFKYKSGGYDEAEAHDAVLDHYRAGRLDPDVWLERGEAYPLTDINEALESVRQRQRVKPLIRLSES